MSHAGEQGANVDKFEVKLTHVARISVGYYGIAEGNPVEKIAKDAARLEKEQG